MTAIEIRNSACLSIYLSIITSAIIAEIEHCWSTRSVGDAVAIHHRYDVDNKGLLQTGDVGKGEGTNANRRSQRHSNYAFYYNETDDSAETSSW